MRQIFPVLLLLFAFSAFAEDDSTEHPLEECELQLVIKDPETLRATIFAGLREPIANRSSMLDRTILSLYRKKIANAIAEKCIKKEGCTDQEILELIQAQITDSHSDASEALALLRRARSGVLVATLVVGSTFVSYTIKSSLPENFDFLSDLVYFVSTLGILKLGKSFWDSVEGISGKASFRIKEGKSPFEPSNDESQFLDAVYGKLGATYTTTQQTTLSLVQGLQAGFRGTLKDVQHQWEAGRKDIAAGNLAEHLLTIRMFYSFLPLDAEYFSRMAHMLLANRIPEIDERRELLRLTMKFLRENSAEISDSQETSEAYESLLRLWLKIPSGAARAGRGYRDVAV